MEYYRWEKVPVGYEEQSVPNPDNGGVSVPTWLFAGLFGLVFGMILGPALMASTKSGSDKLAELSKKYIEK